MVYYSDLFSGTSRDFELLSPQEYLNTQMCRRLGSNINTMVRCKLKLVTGEGMST